MTLAHDTFIKHYPVASMREIPISRILRKSTTSLKRFSETLWKNHDVEVPLTGLPSKVDCEAGELVDPITDNQPVSPLGIEPTLSDYILSGFYTPYQ